VARKKKKGRGHPRGKGNGGRGGQEHEDGGRVLECHCSLKDLNFSGDA